jgi:DNA repair protein RecO
LLHAELSLGRSELGNLHAAQVTRAFPVILRDLARMTVAGSAFSLLRELLPERAPDQGLFAAALGLLEELDAALAEPLLLLLAFQAHVLGLSGFAPRLSVCGACGKHPAAGQSADFDPARGYLVCQHCGGGAYRLRASTRELLAQAFEGEWRQVAHAAWDAAQLAQAQAALGAFIEHRIDRPAGKQAHTANPRTSRPSGKP